MANGEIDISTENLEASIDATAEQQLAMSAQFGSQAQAVMDQLNVGAVERREEIVEDVTSGAGFSGGADVIAELTSDYDTVVSGIQNEMALAQQATIQNLQYQNQATQNYLETMAAQLPALEARLQSQIDMAQGLSTGRGVTSGRSSTPSPTLGLGPPINPLAGTPYQTGPTGETKEVVNEYGDQWGLERTDEEKAAIAKELGMDPDEAFTNHGLKTWNEALGEEGMWQEWYFDVVSEQYGYKTEDLQAAYEAIWGTGVVIEGDEVSGEPERYLNEAVSMINSLIADGMDPRLAHDYSLSSVWSRLEEDYGSTYFVHEPEMMERTRENLEFILNVHYQGHLVSNGLPMDYEVAGMPGDLESKYQTVHIPALSDPENYGTDDWDPDPNWFKKDSEFESVLDNREAQLHFAEWDPIVDRDAARMKGIYERDQRLYGMKESEPDLMSVMAGVDAGKELLADEFADAVNRAKSKKQAEQDPLLRLAPPPIDIPEADYLGLPDEFSNLIGDQSLIDAVSNLEGDVSGIGEGQPPKEKIDDNTSQAILDAWKAAAVEQKATSNLPKGAGLYTLHESEIEKRKLESLPPGAGLYKLHESEIAKKLPTGAGLYTLHPNEVAKRKTLPRGAGLYTLDQSGGGGMIGTPEIDYEQANDELALFLQQKEKEKKEAEAEAAAAIAAAQSKTKPKTANPQINSLIRSQQAAKENARKYANFRIF